jgi:hypothetical protein
MDGQETGSGYSVAGQITVGFDGGNHPLKGDILRCRSCGSLLLPADQDIHDRLHTLIDKLLLRSGE